MRTANICRSRRTLSPRTPSPRLMPQPPHEGSRRGSVTLVACEGPCCVRDVPTKAAPLPECTCQDIRKLMWIQGNGSLISGLRANLPKVGGFAHFCKGPCGRVERAGERV